MTSILFFCKLKTFRGFKSKNLSLSYYQASQKFNVLIKKSVNVKNQAKNMKILQAITDVIHN